MPFDAGIRPTRIGSRTGPAAIREQSSLIRAYQPPHSVFNPLELLNVVDCGNADTTSSVVEQPFEEIELAASTILNAGAAPVAFGSDGMISLPLMRAAKLKYPNLTLLHIDAHAE